MEQRAPEHRGPARDGEMQSISEGTTASTAIGETIDEADRGKLRIGMRPAAAIKL
jgi:hypothetical protein